MSCLRSTRSACAGEAVDADARAAGHDVSGGDDDVRPRDPARAFDAESAGGCRDPDDTRLGARDRGRGERAVVGRGERRHRPAICGNGSTRESARSTVRGGASSFSCCRTVDCCTSARSEVCPGSWSRTAPATQTRPRPSAAPAISPPIESRAFSGGITARPPRANEPAIAGDRLEHGGADQRADEPGDRRVGRAGAAVEHVRRQAGADDRPGRQACEGECGRDQPAAEPGEGSERGDRERDPVDARHQAPFTGRALIPAATLRRDRGRSSVG